MTAPCKSNVHYVAKKAMKGEPNDRISNLPSQVLERVLGSMPLRDAIRTSILSRRWRYNWARLSQLVFDEEFFQKLPWVTLKGPDFGWLPLIISEVLHLHKGPILKFDLWSPPISLKLLSRFNDLVDGWMLFLSTNGVKELILVNSHHAKYRLGSSFFSCSELTHLELQFYDFEPPSSFNGFQYLTSLFFRDVSIRTNVLEAVISSATLLENLTLQHCPVDTVNITASNLKYLHIDGAVKSIAMTNTTNLVEAYLSVYQLKNHQVHQKSDLIEVCGYAPRVGKLVLAQAAFGIFAADGMPTKLPTELLYLKHLELSHIIFSEPDEFLCALCLIRSSPNLGTLQILSPTFKFVGVDTAMKLSEETYFEGFTLDKLQTVRMLDVKGLSPELYLIKFLLASAPRLDSMFIRRHMYINRNTEFMLSRALMRYPRASPNAKVEYLEPVDEDEDEDED